MGTGGSVRTLKYGYSIGAQPVGDQGAAFGVASQMRLGASAIPGRHERRVALACVGPADTIERQQDRLEIGEINRPGNHRLAYRSLVDRTVVIARDSALAASLLTRLAPVVRSDPPIHRHRRATHCRIHAARGVPPLAGPNARNAAQRKLSLRRAAGGSTAGLSH